MSEEEPPQYVKVVGEVGLVTKNIEELRHGLVRVDGAVYPARCRKEVNRGRWVRVISAGEDSLEVSPLNIWLGSCCC